MVYQLRSLLQIVPESYQIEKQKYQQEVYGEFRIKRTEVETKTESPDRYSAPLISVDTGNDTAEVRIKLSIPAAADIQWKIIDGGQTL